MSAIYGIINLDRQAISSDSGAIFLKEYQNYKIDRQEQKQMDFALFGCAIQYFTEESKAETLPILDETHHLLFTADCLLDNRDTLLRELSIQEFSVPDGTLIYQSYLKWGKHCISHLRGIFSFVVYDWEKNEVFLFSDHFANRCLFYHQRNGTLYFSTLLFPMIKASGLRYRLNERWLLDCISLRSPAMMIESRECAYEDVWKVDSAHFVHVKKTKITYHSYWNPIQNISVNSRIEDTDCEYLVRSALNDSVLSALRTDKDVAIQLSSGLDSSTIACIAAPILYHYGKNLYSFTSIPLKPKKSSYYIDDESEGVREICKYYPNIKPTFLDCEGKNILTQSQHILDVWELPCKSEQNAVWIDEIQKTASQKCKIILTGATGNCTLSAGRIEDYFIEHLRQFHFIKGIKEFNHFFTQYHIRKKAFLKSLIKNTFTYHTRFFHPNMMDCYQNNVTRKELGEQYALSKRFQKEVLCFPPIKTLPIMRNEMYLPRAYAQIGEIDTKNSLAYGILTRDPLRNVRFVELCLSLPMRCYVNDTYDRRLVREFMHDIVPDSIRTDIRHRGRQSGDNAYRISKSWDFMQNQIHDSIFSPRTTHFLDPKRMHELFDNLNANTLEEHEMDMRMIVDSYLFSEYLKRLSVFCE